MKLICNNCQWKEIKQEGERGKSIFIFNENDDDPGYYLCPICKTKLINACENEDCWNPITHCNVSIKGGCTLTCEKHIPNNSLSFTKHYTF